MDEKQTKPRRPLWFWLFIGLGVIILIFGLGAPQALSSANEQTVTYDVFLKALDEGKIEEVELKSGTLYYTLKEAATLAPTAAPQFNFGFRSMSSASKRVTVYTVTAMNDPELVDRLHAAGVTFSENAGSGNMLLLEILDQFRGSVPARFKGNAFAFYHCRAC